MSAPRGRSFREPGTTCYTLGMHKGTIERAYELAPTCENIEQVRTALKREGHVNVDAHLAGRVIRTDLAKLLIRPD